MSESRTKLTVLICTLDRAGSLDRTMQAFFAQRFSRDYDYELIVVDNGSSDATGQVASDWGRRHPGIVRCLREERRGLTCARNAGIRAARGEIVVFTDDDVLVDAGWLDEIHREFAADPGLMILGGRVLPATAEQQQVSLQPSSERRQFSFPDAGFFLMGANMAFRREVFRRVGGFDTRLGAGRFFAGADEADILYRAMRRGYSLTYSPDVLVYHAHDRRTVEQAAGLEYGYAKGLAAYLVKHALRGDAYAMRILYWTLLKAPKRLRTGHGDGKRRRRQVLGLLVGLMAAPFVMWRGGADALPEESSP